MKIAFLLGSLNRGGTETLLLDVFQNADKAAFKFIGIHRKDGAYKTDFYATEQPLFKLSPKFPFDPIYLWKLRKLLKDENIQIVHAQQPIDALCAWLVRLRTNFKIVLTWHGYDFQIKKLSAFINNFIIKRVHCNIFVSQTQMMHYQKKYKVNTQKCSVVYNGIDFSKLKMSYPSCSLRKDLEISANVLLLGAVGNFNDVRDQMTLCRFLKLLQEQNVLFHFLFVGKQIDSSPQKYDDCVNFCSQNNLNDQVHFLGTRQDVPQILTQLDAFLYASDHDTFGIAIVEAIAAGIPVFVNDWEVMKEVTEDGKYATLYKTKNEKDLLCHFMSFLKNQNSYKENAEKSSQCVQKKYSIKKHIQELINVYNII